MEMKDRRPRKLKKLAKKRKDKADALVMVKCAMTSVMSASQLAMVSASPILKENIVEGRIQKALRIVEIAKNSAEIIGKHMSEIKPWREHASWK
jgi:hypothetical protein